MPYIKQEIRSEFALNFDRWAENPGELNYIITMALGMYGPDDNATIIISEFISHYINLKGKSYQTFNDILGVLYAINMEIARRGFSYKEFVEYIANLSAEFYETIVAPYEDIKIKENGDLEVFKGVK